MTKAKPVPTEFHTLTPHIVVKDAKKAIEFYKKAFGAKQTTPLLMHDGKVMHARVTIGDSTLMLADEMWVNKSAETLGNSPVVIHLNVEDVDTVFKNAVDGGSEVLMPVSDMFWGDRYARIIDPFGHHWSIATHIKDLTHEELEKAKDECMAQAKDKEGCVVQTK